MVVLGAAALGLASMDDEPDPATPAPDPATPAPAQSPPTATPDPTPPVDPCAEYPPPFEATYLPDGFSHRLRRSAGLFKGTNYPTEGLLGHYRGSMETIHINFQIRHGPLPYLPARTRPIRVLDHPGKIGSIEGGWSVKFSNDRCDFRMDTYGITRAETVAVARGLGAIRGRR